MTILSAASELGIEIPTLCYNSHLSPYGGCRVCVVEVSSARAPERVKLMPACITNISDGLIVETNTEHVLKARRFIVEMLLARAPESTEIRGLAEQLEIPIDNREKLDIIGEYLLYRSPKRFDTCCILCGQCVRVCAEVTERHALSFSKRGIKRIVHPPFDKVAETCIGCGSCSYVCPTNTITIEEVS
jgi:NADH dehydrogenase/NADH:ubiquinone oxidoreductase subunit G